jgi:peroxiredoxin
MRLTSAATLLLASTCALVAAASTPAGMWDATVTVGGNEIPFRFEITERGSELRGSFFDGDLRVTSTPATVGADGSLTLPFPGYGAAVKVTWHDDRLEGVYDRGTRGTPYPFKAERARPEPAVSGKVPNIAGEWRIPTSSSKGEQAWRLIVQQNGAQVSASILRVDGDTGTLTGTFRDGHFAVSHFSGARPALYVLTPAADGSLEVRNNRNRYVAVRVTDPRVKTMPEPTNPAMHTRMKNPNEPLQFRFPDLDGHMVTNADPRFKGKVVLVSITGSWCPNCHDEAPFLAELYKKYRSKGLEIVGLAFEEADQLKNPTRVRAFIKEYGIEYPILLAGETEQLAEKLPQAENLNAFPTTFVVGRDGKVRSIHAGFASKATVNYFTQGKKELTEEIERLLAERPGA